MYTTGVVLMVVSFAGGDAMSYLEAPAAKLLASHCCACGRSLVDAVSVELGIGPECREHNDGGISGEVRAEANRLTYSASLLASAGKLEALAKVVEEIRSLGLTSLADRIESRFAGAAKKAKIKVTEVEVDGAKMLAIETPYRRGLSEEFVAAWRTIPGRRWIDGRNVFPAASKVAVWALLKRFFGGEFGVGPSGAFRVPKE